MDENSFIYPLLAEPDTGDPLILDKSENILQCTGNEKKYAISGGIPVILDSDKSDISVSDLHRQHNTTFNYIDHYKKDSEFFDYSEDDISKTTKEEFRRLRQSVIKEIKRKHELVLDVGCGKAWLAESLIDSGKKIISMDVSLKNLSESLDKIPQPEHAALAASVYSIPIRKESVDCIVITEVLEHLSDPALAMEKLISVLKPGGKIIITVPYNEKIEYFLCVHCNRPSPKNAHLQSFNKANISDYLPDTGISYNIKTMSNKYLNRLKLINLFSIFPYSLWRLKDMIFNAVFGKAQRMMISITKTG